MFLDADEVTVPAVGQERKYLHVFGKSVTLTSLKDSYHPTVTGDASVENCLVSGHQHISLWGMSLTSHCLCRPSDDFDQELSSHGMSHYGNRAI